MTNSSEPLINVVKTGKPKMLMRLEPKGTWPSVGVPTSPAADISVTGEQAESNPSWYVHETW
jgi:hypothetical protein